VVGRLNGNRNAKDWKKMMTRAVKIDGVVPVIPTPFRRDETIDYEALAACVRFAADCKLSAVCLPAYGSEFYKLSEAERAKVVETAVAASDGRVPVIGQSNHPSAFLAAEIAKANEARGAALISFALPRIFALGENDLLAYARTVCSAVKLPVLIQDFNPGGATIGPEFCRRLLELCPNFRYTKLEEPLMATKVLAVRQATEDRIGVLEGWGALYMMELLSTGICGVMPGVGMADLLQRVWNLAKRGHETEAWDLYEKLLPQICFSLQNLELFLWLEKDLLAQRGVITADSAHVRSATLTPDEHSWRYGRQLNARIAELGRKQTDGEGPVAVDDKQPAHQRRQPAIEGR
jgi:2-keto-3-deoxy-L-arabinonate dehydratase